MTSYDSSAPDMATRYREAAELSRQTVDGTARNTRVEPHWINETDRFWYIRDIEGGKQFRVVDCHLGSNEPAFDHEALAGKLRELGGEACSHVTASVLPLLDLSFDEREDAWSFECGAKAWLFQSNILRLSIDTRHRAPKPSVTSPDGTRSAFVRDHNIWIFDHKTGQERQLTEGGEACFPFASPPASGGNFITIPNPQTRPSLAWSNDGKTIFTHRIDCRELLRIEVLEMAPPEGGRAKLFSKPVAYPGDKNVPRAHFLAIDVTSGSIQPADCDPVNLGRMCDDFFASGLAWCGNEQMAYFVSTNRGETQASLIEFDMSSGQTRTVFTEVSDSYIDLGSSIYSRSNVHFVHGRNAIVWQSERSGLAQLDLYDIPTGSRQCRITPPGVRVVDVIRILESRDEIWFTASGFAGEVDPYKRSLCRANLDGSDFIRLGDWESDTDAIGQGDFGLFLARLAGIDTESVCAVSPSGDWFVLTSGGVSEPPVSEVFDRGITSTIQLEVGDFTQLKNWSWPEEHFLVANDRKTTIRAVVFKPAGFDPALSYPLIDQIYGGPQTSYTPKGALRDFSDKLSMMDAAALAHLGAFVVLIDGRGTALRDRAFRDHSYGALQRASEIDDHVAAIRQLIKIYPSIDDKRIGITGISAGGYATAHAMLARPDFFKVGVAVAGNYDSSQFLHSWGERFHGLPSDVDYNSQRLTGLAGQLEGKLLLLHGLLDHGCPPSALFQLCDALMEAGKTFDMFIDPVAGHEKSNSSCKKQWDFFVEHLIGYEPPQEVSISLGLSSLVTPLRTLRHSNWTASRH